MQSEWRSPNVKAARSEWERLAKEKNSLPTRTCTLCGETKDKSEFGVARGKASGVDSWCKRCKNERNCTSPDQRYRTLKMHAKQRGIEFSLSKEDYFSLILGASCTYCGVRVRTGGGVDRLDSDGSYKVGNLVACCGVCNALKLDILTPAQMFEVGLLLRKWREDGTLNIPKRFAETRDMPWADPRA